MDDINSALEKIVSLDGTASKLDRHIASHHSNFGEFYYKITSGRPNLVTAQRLADDISILKKRVKVAQKKQRDNGIKEINFQYLFLENVYRALSAQSVFIEYFFNPESNLTIYDFLHHFFEL